MTQSQFSLQSHLDQIYANQSRRFAFTARSLEDYSTWQSAFRAELIRLLGIRGRLPVQSAAEKCHSIDRGAYIEEKYRLAVGDGVQMPLYVLVPKGKPPFKPILVFHGHDPSAQYCMGQYPDPETAQANLAIDNNYALALAEAGYLVAVVEQRGFGERMTDQVSRDYPRSCRHLAFSYLLHGRTLLGERCWDGLCAVSYLLSRPDVTGKLGCTGQSGGGTTTLWLSAIDPRIDVVVVSGYFNSFHGSILSIEHCECNYVPGILELAEMGDIAALIAPRPFCAVNGEKDEIYPVANAHQQFKTVSQAYALHNAADACRLTIYPGIDGYHNGLAQAWFAQWMK